MPAPKGHKPYNTKGEGGVSKKYTKEFIDKEADELEKWMNASERHIFVREFCVERDYDDNRIKEFCAVSDRFAGIYSKCKQKQELKLLSGGLFGDYKEGMTKFVLVNHHNYKEKTESNVKTEGTFTYQIVDFSNA